VWPQGCLHHKTCSSCIDLWGAVTLVSMTIAKDSKCRRGLYLHIATTIQADAPITVKMPPAIGKAKKRDFRATFQHLSAIKACTQKLGRKPVSAKVGADLPEALNLPTGSLQQRRKHVGGMKSEESIETPGLRCEPCLNLPTTTSRACHIKQDGQSQKDPSARNA